MKDWLVELEPFLGPVGGAIVNGVRWYGQSGEDKLLEEVFVRIGTTNKFVLDLGAGNGYACSNTRRFIDLGWDSLLIDADNQGCEEIFELKITCENIISFLESHNLPKEIDLLSLDLDGNDYWIWKTLLENGYSARVSIVEYNRLIGNNLAQAIEYDPEYVRKPHTDFFSASFMAMRNLANAHGLKLVWRNYGNQIFVKNELVTDVIQVDTYIQGSGHPIHVTDRKWVVV